MENNELRICQATAADLPSIFVIEQAAEQYPWTETMLSDCLNKNYYFWIIKNQEEIIGFIIFQIYAAEGHIHNIVIKPSHQKLGYGNKLLKKTLEFMQQHAAKKIFLEVRISNQKAINLYKKFGFEKIGIRKNYYPTENSREDAIVLAINTILLK